MKDNLILRYQQCKDFDYRDKNRVSTAFNELQCVKEYCGLEDYFNLKLFLKSIEGKIVDLTFTHGDAFEQNDNNYWLPDELWEEII